MYKTHRQTLAKKLPNGIIFVAGDSITYRNYDVNYRFRQNSDFLYLTGCEQADHYLLIEGKSGKSHLFIPDIDIKHQVWEGRMLTTAQAKTRYGVDFVHYNSSLAEVAAKLAKGKALYSLKEQSRKTPKAGRGNTDKLREALDECRRIKTDGEIKIMQKANDITAKAHKAAMKAAQTAKNEAELEAMIEYTYKMNGAHHHAYISIVAGGANAAILHYKENNMALKKNELMLIDAGCEINGYASDVTRTFPINGKFSKKQKEIYNIVLDCQNKSIKRAKVGVSYLDVHIASMHDIAKGLAKLGIFKTNNTDEIVKSDAIKIFYPHGLGHLLGLDVHDVGAKKSKKHNLRSALTLEPGMALTIEPGIYFIEAHFNNKETRKKYQDLINWKVADSYYSVGGIRIEDNIIITKTGQKNLTRVPKTVAAIEKWMST